MIILDGLYTVYVHKTPSNKFYVGITGRPVEVRWQKGGGGYRGQVFFRAIQKYGWDNIEHRIIATDLPLEEACYLEQELIAVLKSNISGYGYNVASGGESNKGIRLYGQNNHFFGKHHTEQAKKVIGYWSKRKSPQAFRKMHDGYLKYVEQNGHPTTGRKRPQKQVEWMSFCKGYPVCQFSLDGAFIAWYPNSGSANRAVNTSGNHILQVCRHEKRYKTCKGYKWEFAENVPEEIWKQSREQYIQQHGVSSYLV